ERVRRGGRDGGCGRVAPRHARSGPGSRRAPSTRPVARAHADGRPGAHGGVGRPAVGRQAVPRADRLDGAHAARRRSRAGLPLPLPAPRARARRRRGVPSAGRGRHGRLGRRRRRQLRQAHRGPARRVDRRPRRAGLDLPAQPGAARVAVAVRVLGAERAVRAGSPGAVPLPRGARGPLLHDGRQPQPVGRLARAGADPDGQHRRAGRLHLLAATPDRRARM
ncbi:MAG: Signal peptidase I, partial [uncultured Thermoleophilia bacterium]